VLWRLVGRSATLSWQEHSGFFLLPSQDHLRPSVILTLPRRGWKIFERAGRGPGRRRRALGGVWEGSRKRDPPAGKQCAAPAAGGTPIRALQHQSPICSWRVAGASPQSASGVRELDGRHHDRPRPRTVPQRAPPGATRIRFLAFGCRNCIFFPPIRPHAWHRRRVISPR